MVRKRVHGFRFDSPRARLSLRRALVSGENAAALMAMFDDVDCGRRMRTAVEGLLTFKADIPRMSLPVYFRLFEYWVHFHPSSYSRMSVDDALIELIDRLTLL